MKNKQMYEISLILFYSFFFGGGGGGIGYHFANFARDVSLNAVVMSKMSNFTICGVSTPPPPPPPCLPQSLLRSPNPFLF